MPFHTDMYAQIQFFYFLELIDWLCHNLQDNGLCMTFRNVHPQRTPHSTASLPLLLHTCQKCLRPCLLRPSHAQFIRHCETDVQIHLVRQQPIYIISISCIIIARHLNFYFQNYLRSSSSWDPFVEASFLQWVQNDTRQNVLEVKYFQ